MNYTNKTKKLTRADKIYRFLTPNLLLTIKRTNVQKKYQNLCINQYFRSTLSHVSFRKWYHITIVPDCHDMNNIILMKVSRIHLHIQFPYRIWPQNEHSYVCVFVCVYEETKVKISFDRKILYYFIKKECNSRCETINLELRASTIKRPLWQSNKCKTNILRDKSLFMSNSFVPTPITATTNVLR